MMAALCGQKYKDGRAVTDREVAHMLTALLMAGQHTSSSNVAWTVMHLANSPAIAYVFPPGFPWLAFTVFSAIFYMRNN
jgi:cytochrome P450